MIILIDYEKLLSEEKSEYENLEAPQELECKLKEALSKATYPKRYRTVKYLKAAAVIILCIFLSYNFSTFAFYGRKITGYDSVLSSSLKDINNLGKGQNIGKSYFFKNGFSVTLDGIIIDDNQMIMFYTLKTPGTIIQNTNFFSNGCTYGNLGIIFERNGTGIYNSNNTEEKCVTSFEPPSSYDKEFTWRFSFINNKHNEAGTIVFRIDPSKALGHSIKENLNKSIYADNTSINIKSITASPTQTKIEGSVGNLYSFITGILFKRPLHVTAVEFKLIADAKEIPHVSGSIGTNEKGITFTSEFDAIPQDTKKLDLKLISFSADHSVKKSFDISKNQKITVLGQDIIVNSVSINKGFTEVTITTKDTVLLSKVYLLSGTNKLKLKETIDKTKGSLGYTRTLRFAGTGKNLQLDIERISYETSCNKVIPIPIN